MSALSFNSSSPNKFVIGFPNVNPTHPTTLLFLTRLAQDRRSHFISYNLVETFMEVNVAKLSQEIKITVRNLKEQLLDIIDESKGMEYEILGRFGENSETIPTLEQLTEITEQARTRFSQLSNLRLRIAEVQPSIPSDLLKLMSESIANVQSRIPALKRSIEEIKLDWSLQ
jgi:hypothetical protein